MSAVYRGILALAYFVKSSSLGRRKIPSFSRARARLVKRARRARKQNPLSSAPYITPVPLARALRKSAGELCVYRSQRLLGLAALEREREREREKK